MHRTAMQMAKDGILIQESSRDALCKLHKALSKLGYVREEGTVHSAFHTYRRECAKFSRKTARLTLDIKRHTIHSGGNAATLTNHECLLLKHLIEHPRNTVPRDVILARVFGNACPPKSDIISPCVCTLRRKLKSIGYDNVIQNIRRSGYRLSPQYLTRITIGNC